MNPALLRIHIMDQDNSFSVMHKNQACMGIICFGVYTILWVMTYNDDNSHRIM